MAVEQINPDPLQPQGARDSDVKVEPEVTKIPLEREDSREPPSTGDGEVIKEKQTIGQKAWASFKTPGSALQIIAAAILAIAIGLAVSTTVSDIPDAAPVILEIPGSLWLRALRATGKSEIHPATSLNEPHQLTPSQYFRSSLSP